MMLIALELFGGADLPSFCLNSHVYGQGISIIKERLQQGELGTALYLFV